MRLENFLSRQSPAFLASYRAELDMSWVYHDTALEGTVYTFEELRTAFDPVAFAVVDSSMQPTCVEIQRHREALEFIRDLAPKKKVPITIDTIRKLYCILHPEEGDVRNVKWRKELPQHRLYFHEYAAPDKIAPKVKAIVDWLSEPEAAQAKSQLKVAVRVHFDLLRVFPFAEDSGKVARLLMNLILLRHGYPPAIIHSTERQRYYEALRGASAMMAQIVQESIENNLSSIEKLLHLNTPEDGSNASA